MKTPIFNVQGYLSTLLEGGLDKFRVTEGTSVTENEQTLVSLYPNPANNFVNLVVDKPGSLNILDVSGKQVGTQLILKQGVNRIQVPTAAGVYLCEIMVNNERHVQRLLVQ